MRRAPQFTVRPGRPAAVATCRRGKRTARDTQAYEAHLLDKLVGSRDALSSASWRPSRTFSFVVSRPKLREIHAAPFADRVVHHVITERLARLYEPVFIHDSYANRLGKGTHAAVDRLQTFMRSVTQGGAVPAHALQLDIANFFNSIHRPTLFRLLQHRLARRRVVQRLQGCLRQFERLHVRTQPTVGQPASLRVLRLPPAAVQHLRAQLASYVGHLRHANSLRLWQRTLAQYPWLQALFTLPQPPSQPLALGQPRWEPLAPSGLAGQHAWCTQQWPGVRPLVQVGNAWLLVGPCPAGLPSGQAVARPGLGPCTEWPLALLPRLRQRLKALAVPHAVLAQVGHCKTGFKRRALVALWRPRAAAPVQLSLF